MARFIQVKLTHGGGDIAGDRRRCDPASSDHAKQEVGSDCAAMTKMDTSRGRPQALSGPTSDALFGDYLLRLFSRCLEDAHMHGRQRT